MKAGDRVLSYIVDRELGEGGMGTVYLARHTALDQFVAIKSLSLMLSRDEALRARFLQEANIQAKLRHPGIVQVLTADMESEQPSLVMEYIEGKSLSEVLELRGALPIDDALKIMDQVLSAVGYAHRQGVIHRDLKPSNVMVMGSGEAKVTDFGIAKVLGSSKLTRTGTAMGSAHYMSPEQIRRPETVDARSDIYSLGCVFYEVLTGRPPFGEKDASGTESDYEVKTAHVSEAVPALETVKPDIPAWLAQLVMTMLEKESDQRPSSCEAILETLTGRGKLEKNQPLGQNENPDRKSVEDKLKDAKDISRGADLHYNLEITLEQAANGFDTTISVPSQDTCNTCHGSGAKPTTLATTCFACGGSGLIKGEKTLAVKIPSGIDDGMRIRSTGHGEPGMNGGSPGDLYVEIHIKPHTIFQRDGDDLHFEMPISFSKAAIGGEIEVPTLSGMVSFSVPEGTQTGKTFRLRGKGIKGVGSESPGDLFCHVLIETPVNLTEKQKDLFKKTEEVNSAENWAKNKLKMFSLIGPIFVFILIVWILTVMWLE